MTTDGATFGSLVKRFMESHDLSYQTLVDELGYRSKTSISRIVQDNTSYQLRHEFYKLLCEKYTLSPDEKSEMEFTLKLSRLADEHQPLFLFFKDLFGRSAEDESLASPIRLVYTKGAHELDRLLKERSCGAYKVTAVLFGSFSSRLLITLYHLLESLDCAFSIRQYLVGDHQAELFTQTIASAASFLFDQRYQLYYMPLHMLPAHTEHQFILHYERQSGSEDDDLFLQINETDLFFQRFPNDALYKCYENILSLPGIEPKQLKTRVWLQADRILIEGFIKQQQSLLEIEDHQVIYRYQKDLTVELIPPEIYKNALQLNYFPDKKSMELRNELTDLQRQRYQNIRTKHSSSYYILSQESLKTFIWTGRLKNHPLLLRPFSPKERTQILNGLLLMLKENPFFFLRIASDDIPQLWNLLSLCCCQHLKRASSHKPVQEEALLLLPAIQPAGEYISLVLTHPDIISSYASFYMEELWQKHTLPAKRSIHILQLMLQYQAAKFSSNS